MNGPKSRARPLGADSPPAAPAGVPSDADESSLAEPDTAPPPPEEPPTVEEPTPAKAPASAPVAPPKGLVRVTSVHGQISHDGCVYMPGDPIDMSAADAALLGDRVKPVK